MSLVRVRVCFVCVRMVGSVGVAGGWSVGVFVRVEVGAWCPWFVWSAVPVWVWLVAVVV